MREAGCKFGHVVEKGPLAMSTNAQRSMGDLEVGTKVVFRQYAGDPLRIEGDPGDFLYRLITDSEVELILEDDIEIKYEQ